ncbi:reverse transcriptase [Phytophthora megakarya]|uniref:Reverse transcriptase n=1 Tax=Phytophthora megakarya TaxID=4795 RepID=A0A225UFZ0_9STRA|nr:reverse transcriptase [Phytophthora megakarya]
MIKQHFHWRGLFRDVHRYVGECVDGGTGKARPTIQGRSPVNLQVTYSFQIIAMDHILSLPKSYKGNTELLVWADSFTGYVVAKASDTRTTQQIAESYEESVFRCFVDQRQGPTMVYRPQANGTAERMVQTLTRAVKMYVADVNQKD